MLSNLSTWLYRVASWKTLLASAAAYIVFPAYVLKNLEASMNAHAGKTLGPIDLLMFGFQPERIQEMVASYGDAGRALYAQGELTADVVYPVVYTFLLCILLTLLYRNRAYAPFRLVNVVPLAGLLADFLENACIVYLLKTYPAMSPTVAALCSVFTNLKWGSAFLALGLILYGLIRLAVQPKRSLATP